MATEYNSRKPKDFNGKVVLITGAATGIGAAVAVEFARHGAILSLLDSKDLDETAENCVKASGAKPFENTILKTIGDLKNNSTRLKYVTDTIVNFNKVDVLVNCTTKCSEDSNLNLESFDLIIATTIRSVYHLCIMCMPHLIKTRGNILNVSSVASISANQNLSSCSIAKAALDDFTKQLATELISKGVRVNSVNPLREKWNKFTKTSTDPVQGHEEHIARAIVLVASPRAGIITGSNIVFDGDIASKLP